jgi:K+ transporter
MQVVMDDVERFVKAQKNKKKLIIISAFIAMGFLCIDMYFYSNNGLTIYSYFGIIITIVILIFVVHHEWYSPKGRVLRYYYENTMKKNNEDMR